MQRPAIPHCRGCAGRLPSCRPDLEARWGPGEGPV